MHFFTEPLKIQNQTSNQAFGAIDVNQYRLGNMFSAISGQTPKAFAITDGQVLVQKIGATNKYSIILKPTVQPDLNLPKIDYIIYKGIKEDSLISGTLVAPATESDLTRIIHENATAWYGAKNPIEDVPDTEPDASRSLGLVYNATAVEPDYLKLDTAPLSDAFFATNGITLTTVFGGNHIGDFDTSGDFGIVIVFEKIGFQPTFKLARELDSLLTFTPLGGSPTNADIFQRKHKKEDVLTFLDSGAFFGAFSVSEIKVYNGTTFESKTGDSLYTEVLSKHFNKNKIYIDIRNDFDDSFNYYENYNNNIKWSLDNSNTLVDVNYYRNFGWPILVINDGQTSPEFSATNTDKIIKLSFPSSNQTMLVYFKKVFRNELAFNVVNDKFFVNPTLQNGHFLIEDLKTPKSTDRSISNYFQIKILTNAISSNAVPPTTVNDFQIPRETYLDNLFPVFDMTIPFDSTTGKSLLKIYYDSSFVDKKYINNSNYTSNIGIAKDSNFVTLISFPHKYNLNIKQNKDDKIPVSGMEGVSGSLFLLELDSKVSSIKLVKSKFTINSVDIEFLKFVSETTAVSTIDSEEPVGLTTDKFTFDDVTVLALTTAEYDVLLQLKNTEFTDDYKVYLGIHNIVTDVDDNGITYTKFEYCLRSLKNDGSGNIIVYEAFPTTPIISYTDSKLNGVEYERNYEEAIGYDNFQSGTLRYEDYFIGLQSPIETLVNEFEQKLNDVDLKSVNLFKEIKSLVRTKSKALWQAAYNYVQSHPTQPDDRPLYWARLKMGIMIKKHPYFLGDLDVNSQIIAGSQLNEVITLFEENSRNYKGVDFSAAPAGAKKILITGFDPFQLSPSFYGSEAIKTQNPSGIAALSLHSKLISDSIGNNGFIQATIFPVRYIDFDKNVVEDLVTPFLSDNSIDMIISLSLNGSAYYFDLERFAVKNRGGFHDNMGIGTSPVWADSTFFSQISSPGNDFYETTLPIDKIVDSNVANGFNAVGQRIFFDQSYFGSNPTSFNEHPIVSAIDTNITNTNAISQLSVTDIVQGSGGDYLSNEIFYRIARVRENTTSNVKTGHYHLANPQGELPIGIINRHPSIVNTITPSSYSTFTLIEILDEVKNALKRCLNAI
jgi:pyrrolidone-carboxylate peptidase